MIGARMIALVAAAALTLGACHKRDAGVDALDDGADARARTAAKTLADLAAADQAAGAPLPRAPVAKPARRTPDAASPAEDEATIRNASVDGN